MNPNFFNATNTINPAILQKPPLANGHYAHDAEYNQTDIKQLYPLHLAIHRGAAPTIRMLINDPNIDLQQFDAKGQTPLHLAAKYNDLNTIQMLMDREVDLNKMNTQKETALHVAAREGHSGTVELLVKAGADIFTVITDINVDFTGQKRALDCTIDSLSKKTIRFEPAYAIITLFVKAGVSLTLDDLKSLELEEKEYIKRYKDKLYTEIKNRYSNAYEEKQINSLIRCDWILCNWTQHAHKAHERFKKIIGQTVKSLFKNNPSDLNIKKQEIFQSILQIEIGIYLKNHLFKEAKTYDSFTTTASAMILKFHKITSETRIQEIVDDRYISMFEQYKKLVFSLESQKQDMFEGLNQRSPTEKEDFIINNSNSLHRMLYLYANNFAKNTILCESAEHLMRAMRSNTARDQHSLDCIMSPLKKSISRKFLLPGSPQIDIVSNQFVYKTSLDQSSSNSANYDHSPQKMNFNSFSR